MTVSRPIHLLLRLLLPFVAASIIGVCLFSVLRWSADRADAVAMARQQELVETIVSNMQSSIAHDQEGVTVWDDAVRGVLRNDKTWMAANLGRWMYTYFQHDGAFVVNPDRQMIYGFASDAQDEDTAFRHVRDAALPLVDKLQERLKASDTTGVSDRILSIGESDLNIVNGRPAIVSVKPIVSDTGDIAQVPGRQFVHVAVRYLDSSFRSILGKKYGLEDIRFTWSNIAGIGRAYSVLTTGSGATFGYLTWKPFRPGATVVAETLPAIAVTSGVIFVLGALLGQMVWKRSLRLEASQARLQQLANYDVLTGLANRATFNRRLDQALGTSSQGEPNAVLFLDLDRFKQVNDTLGHPVGDRLIIQVSRRLRDVLPDAVIARIGGDEFTIILEAAGEQRAAAICDTIIKTICQPFELDGHKVTIGVSVGVALAEGSDLDPSNLIRQADIALYHAKAAGRGRYAIFGSHMDELVQSRRHLERDLRAALDEGGQLEVHYQPVYDAGGGGPIAAEALLRWKHPTRGNVPPDVFIPVAEETGLIGRIGDFVIADACETASRWPKIEIAINASAIELRSETYALRVTAALERYGVDPRRLEIELTESALVDSSGQCERNIAHLRALGLRIALDDFGTGFSSFSRLQHIEVDRIKIDKSFIDAIGTTGGNPAIVRAMIALAHGKGLKTTAEGVETSDQRALLQALGCDQLQGYLLSKPLAKDHFAALMEDPDGNLKDPDGPSGKQEIVS